MSYAIYERQYITDNDVSGSDFYESIAKIYSFLKNNKCDIVREQYKTVLELIPIEECLDCGCIYFHNYGDVGIEEGEGYMEEWKCTNCVTKYQENDLLTFESTRQECREIKKSELQISETNEEEKCSICLDELRICEINSWETNEKNVSLYPCAHTLCAKCNFDLINSNEDIICPLCRTQIVKN
jgi:hypothetical protein